MVTLGRLIIGISALNFLVFADHTHSDVDVPAAKAKYEQKVREAEDAQQAVNHQDHVVHQVEGKYYDALSEEKKAKENLKDQQALLTQIENELPALKTEAENLTNQIASLKSKKQTLESELAALEPQLPPLQAKLSQLQKELIDLESKLASEKAKAAPYFDELKSLEAERVPLVKQISHTETLISKAQSQITSNKDEIAATQKEIDLEKAKEGPNQEKIGQFESKKSSLKSDIALLQNNVHQLETSINALKQQQAALQSEIEKEKQKLGPTQTKIEQLEKEVKLFTDKQDALQKKETLLETQIENSKKEIASLESQIKEESAKPNPNKEKLLALNKKKHQEELELKKYEKGLEETNKAITEIGNKLAKAQAELAEAKNSVKPILDKIAELESQNKKLATDLTNLQSQQNSLKSQIQSKNNEIASIQKEIDIEKAKQGPDQAKIDRLEKKKAELQTLLVNTESELKKLESELLSLKTKIAKIEARISSIKTLLAPMQATITDLSEQVQAIKNQIASVQSSINDVISKINTKKNQINTTQTEINKAQNDLASANNKIASHAARLEAQKRIVHEAEETLRKKTENVHEWTHKIDHEKEHLAELRSRLQVALAARDKAYQYLQEVIANYEKEKARIIELANQTGSSDGLREAQDRASQLGNVAGAESARRIGYAEGSQTARIRDERRGYRDGRQAALTDPALTPLYQEGRAKGIAIAQNKAVTEVFPKGYNEALTATLSVPPALNLTMDISTEFPQDPGENGTELSPDQKPFGSVVSPNFPLPLDPTYLVPSVDNPHVSIPSRDNRYFNPPCHGLKLHEFETMCRDQYDPAYERGYEENYVSIFRNTYRESFNNNIKSAYDTGLSETFPAAFAAGRNEGARDQGILNGFNDELPQASASQLTAGKKAFNDSLVQGNLIVVRSATLTETSGDGLYTPGELVKVDIILDNYGKKASLLKGLVLKVKDKQGLGSFNFEVRELPSLPADTRTTLKGTITATITEQVAGEKIRVRADLERINGSLLGTVQDEKGVHFPLELMSITLDKDPKVDEPVGATLKFKNLTQGALPQASLNLSTNPNIVSVESNPLSVSPIESGAETQIRAKLKPGVWVGENTFVNFLSQTIQSEKSITQEFRKKIHMNRFGSLLLFNSNGVEVPTSTLSVAAGHRLSLITKLRSNGSASNGRVRVAATSKSDPEISHANGSTTAVDYGHLGSGFKEDTLRFSYEFPESLKGKKTWVMIQLSENSKAIHALQIFVNVK